MMCTCRTYVQQMFFVDEGVPVPLYGRQCTEIGTIIYLNMQLSIIVPQCFMMFLGPTMMLA